MIHRIDSRFLIADDGRLIFRTLRHFVVIPESDLGLVRRRNFQANAFGVFAVILSNIGWPATYWRPWWLLVGIAAWIGAFLMVGRWARERYPETSGLVDAGELRAAISRADTRTVSSDAFAGVVALLSTTLAVAAPRPHSPAVLFLLTAVLHFTGAFRRRKRTSEIEAESGSAPSSYDAGSV
jgi:hypothetical protein